MRKKQYQVGHKNREATIPANRYNSHKSIICIVLYCMKKAPKIKETVSYCNGIPQKGNEQCWKIQRRKEEKQSQGKSKTQRVNM